MNRNVSTGPLARPFACSLARTAHSRFRGQANDSMYKIDLVLPHSVMVVVAVEIAATEATTKAAAAQVVVKKGAAVMVAAAVAVTVVVAIA